MCETHRKPSSTCPNECEKRDLESERQCAHSTVHVHNFAISFMKLSNHNKTEKFMVKVIKMRWHWNRQFFFFLNSVHSNATESAGRGGRYNCCNSTLLPSSPPLLSLHLSLFLCMSFNCPLSLTHSALFISSILSAHLSLSRSSPRLFDVWRLRRCAPKLAAHLCAQCSIEIHEQLLQSPCCACSVCTVCV